MQKVEKKLELNKDTIRQLTEDELDDVNAAGTVGCTWARCPAPATPPTEEC